MKNNKKTYRKNLKIEIISDILIIVILIMNIFSQNVIKIKATEEKNGSFLLLHQDIQFQMYT